MRHQDVERYRKIAQQVATYRAIDGHTSPESTAAALLAAVATVTASAATNAAAPATGPFGAQRRTSDMSGPVLFFLRAPPRPVRTVHVWSAAHRLRHCRHRHTQRRIS